MAIIKEKYKGQYEIVYSHGQDLNKASKPQTTVCKRIEIMGPPFIAVCYKNNKDPQPALIIPLNQLIGIYQQAEEESLNEVVKRVDKVKISA